MCKIRWSRWNVYSFYVVNCVILFLGVVRLMQTTIKQHYIPRFYMKNFYIKNSKKFDVLDKSNCYAPISQNKNENFKKLFYVDNLYENCNENVNYIETQILANDNEDNMKKDLENIINKIHNKDSLNVNDKRFLRILSVQMSIRNPYGVKAVEEKYNNVSDRELFFKYSFANDECSQEKRKIADVMQGYFNIVIFTTRNSSFILSDCFSLKMLTNTIKNTHSKEIDVLNYVDIYPLTKDILICVISNKNEVVKVDKLFIELLPQEVSSINKLMMCHSGRYCIGDLNRYKSRLSTDLKHPKLYEEKYLKILKKYCIINGKEKKGC